MFSVLAFTLVSALAASATNFTVNVGANNGLVFEPNSVMAQAGDNILFQFQSKNHSVTQSTFASPCVKSPTGIDSGFMPVAANATSQPLWIMQVADTTPLWFFCAQTNPAVHCAAGMVFAVNPTANKTFAQFQAAAMGSTGNSTASVSGSVIPAPSTLPTGGPVAGASGAAASGFSTVASGSSPTGSAAGAASSSAHPNGAVGLNSAGAVSLVSMFAAVAGFML